MVSHFLKFSSLDSSKLTLATKGIFSKIWKVQVKWQPCMFHTHGVILLSMHVSAYLLARLFGTGSSRPHKQCQLLPKLLLQLLWLTPGPEALFVVSYVMKDIIFSHKIPIPYLYHQSRKQWEVTVSTNPHKFPFVLAFLYFMSAFPSWLSALMTLGNSTKHRRNNFHRLFKQLPQLSMENAL